MSTAPDGPPIEDEEVEAVRVAASVVAMSSPAVEAMTRAEIDRQIATAKAYPRADLKVIVKKMTDLATLDPETADDCMYALPRGGKTIEGQSVRFAEIVQHSYGNCRSGTRVIDADAKHVTAQAFFHDLESNSAVMYEVKRRITGKSGKTYDEDMITVTGNAACAIALRNAILKAGIPEPIWRPAYNAAVKMVKGGSKANVATRRAQEMEFLQKFGASEVMVLETLGVEKVDDITDDHLVKLKGLAAAMRTGETSVDEAFVPEWKAVKQRNERRAGAVYEDVVAGGGRSFIEMLYDRFVDLYFIPRVAFVQGAPSEFDAGFWRHFTANYYRMRNEEPGEPITSEANLEPGTPRKMLKYLEGAAATTGTTNAGPTPVVVTKAAAPAATLVPKCEFAGCGRDSVGIAGDGTWCAEHMPAGDEAAEEGPALEEEPSPADAAAVAGQRAQDDVDGDVSTLIDLLEKAAKHPRFGRPLASMDAVKKGGEPIGLWMKNAEIQKAHGIFRTTLLTEEGEQRVEPELCRKYVKWLREALAAK